MYKKTRFRANKKVDIDRNIDNLQLQIWLKTICFPIPQLLF